MEVAVSIIVPVYNGEKTINNCIDSLLNQTLYDIEIVVVDDGSVDGTLSVLSAYNDKRLIIVSQKNMGQGFARNKGISVSSGKYIGFVDADDTVQPQMYEKMLNCAEQNNAEVVQCAINDIKENITIIRPEVDDGLINISDNGKYAHEYFYHYKHTNEVCNKLILKSFLEENSLTFGDTKKLFSEDLKFNLDMLSYIKRIYYIKEPLYNYYIKNEGHCLSLNNNKTEKICNLYKMAAKNTKNSDIRKCIECNGANTVLQYCSTESKEKAFAILKDRYVRHLMLVSMTYGSGFKHFMLMIAILLSPVFLKFILIKKYYSF